MKSWLCEKTEMPIRFFFLLQATLRCTFFFLFIYCLKKKKKKKQKVDYLSFVKMLKIT